MKQLYVLELEGGRFLVGMSATARACMAAHFAGTRGEWTRRYRPIGVMEGFPRVASSAAEEDYLTLQLMVEHGIDRVRGGVSHSADLPAEQRQALQRRIWHARGVCTECGSAEHCGSEHSGAVDATPAPARKPSCERCGRASHCIEECYASHDIYGGVCKPAHAIARSGSGYGCARCGFKSHVIRKCYARRDVHGAELPARRSSGRQPDRERAAASAAAAAPEAPACSVSDYSDDGMGSCAEFFIEYQAGDMMADAWMNGDEHFDPFY